MIAAIRWSERTKEVIRIYDIPVCKFAFVKVTLGESIAYATIFVALVMLGMVAAGTIARYHAIAEYCLATTDFAPLTMGNGNG
jgi:hypothetical protein